MFDPKTMLLTHYLQARAAEIAADPAAAAPWEAAKGALGALKDVDPDVLAAVDAKDPAALRGILDLWIAGKRPLVEHDRDLLKRAMRAFRKRLNLTLLDAESNLGGRQLTGGRSSSISGISPPRDYARDIWLELARQGKLVNAGQGVFELPRGMPEE
jgi:hypothetical protein